MLDIKKFNKIVAMMNNPSDKEADIARRIANKMLAAAGKTWYDVLAPSITIEERPRNYERPEQKPSWEESVTYRNIFSHVKLKDPIFITQSPKAVFLHFNGFRLKENDIWFPKSQLVIEGKVYYSTRWFLIEKGYREVIDFKVAEWPL